MKQVEVIAENKNYTAVSIGRLDELTGYSFIHPKSGKEVVGKVFVKETTKATGSEISFTSIPPHTELGYSHFHKKDEETYLILRGSGYYQVDDDCFSIAEGSVVRVAPAGKRSLCNTSDEAMIYICIQSKEHSLEEHTYEDGKRVDADLKWRK